MDEVEHSAPQVDPATEQHPPHHPREKDTMTTIMPNGAMMTKINLNIQSQR